MDEVKCSHVRVAGDSLLINASDADVGDMKGIVVCLHCYLTARDEVCIELPVTIESVVRLYLTRILVDAILGRVGIEKSERQLHFRFIDDDFFSYIKFMNDIFEDVILPVVCFSSSSLICNGSAGQWSRRDLRARLKHFNWLGSVRRMVFAGRGNAWPSGFTNSLRRHLRCSKKM